MKSIPNEIYIIFGKIISIQEESKKLKKKIRYKFENLIQSAKERVESEKGESRWYDSNEINSCKYIAEGALEAYKNIQDPILQLAIDLEKKSKFLKHKLYEDYALHSDFIDSLFKENQISSNIKGKKRQELKGNINELIRKFRNIHKTGSNTEYPPNGEFEHLPEELFFPKLNDKEFLTRINQNENRLISILNFISKDRNTLLELKKISYNTRAIRIYCQDKKAQECISIRNKIQEIITELDILTEEIR